MDENVCKFCKHGKMFNNDPFTYWCKLKDDMFSEHDRCDKFKPKVEKEEMQAEIPEKFILRLKELIIAYTKEVPVNFVYVSWGGIAPENEIMVSQNKIPEPSLFYKMVDVAKFLKS